MEVALLIYAIYVLAMLFWCASRMLSLRYVSISTETLNQWSASRNNLIVIHLRTKTIPSPEAEIVPGVLEVSAAELPSLLRWIPPQSSLVFCGPRKMLRFDSKIEELLFRAKINPVYFVARPVDPSRAKPRIPRDTSVPKLGYSK